MTKPKKTDAEKRQAQIAKMKKSLERKPQNSFNCAIIPHEPLRANSFACGLFHTN